MKERRRRGASRARSFGAHEIGNYLSVIQLSALGLRLSCRPGTADFARLAAILHAAAQAGAVCRRVWLGVRDPRAPGRPADLRAIVRKGCAVLARAAGRRLPVSHSSETTLLVRADPAQLDQILVNLVLNAWNAVGAGGRVGVSLGRCSGNRCYFEVWDEGPGFRPVPRASVSLKRRRAMPGRGLGLLIVRRLAHSMGGSVRFESGIRSGARVRVALPAERPAYQVSLRDAELPAES